MPCLIFASVLDGVLAHHRECVKSHEQEMERAFAVQKYAEALLLVAISEC